MARILAYTSPARGHLFPITPILDELRSRGHEIALRTLSAEVDRMRSRGFEVEPIDQAIEHIRHDDYLARTPQAALKRALATFARRAGHDGPDLHAAIRAVDPDLLLVDINSWGACAVAQASSRAWAAWCPYPMPHSSPEVPPFGPGLAPARGPAGRIRDSVLRPLLTSSYARALLPAINQARERLGAPALRDPADMFVTPPLLIYMTAEPFEYHRSSWPENVALVGPCTWEPPADPPAWLAQINRPIVLVTTSSEFQDDGRLVQTALEALANEPMTIVATLPALDPTDFNASPNARIERFIPHRPVLERAACAVTHGGMGATQKALALGVPVCAVPFGRDQLEVARRVEVAGAGTRLPARRLTAQGLREKVRAAMTCTHGAQRVAAGFAAAGGPTRATDAVERLLGSRPRPQVDPRGPIAATGAGTDGLGATARG
jgi:MGT family glycosyltransferase